MTESLFRRLDGVVWVGSVSIRTLRDSLRQNFGLAVIAMGLSTLLWLVVTSEQNPPKVDVFPSGIPVTAINVPAGLEVFGDVEPVRVKVSGPQEVWNRLRPASFRITADLSKAGVGVQEIAISGQVMDSQARVVEYIPPRVTIRLEAVKSKEVPVSINLIDSVPFGYVYKQPLSSQEKVAVIGPGALVDQVDVAVADVKLEGVKVDIKESIKLSLRSAQGNKIEGVRSDPQAVEVEVPISQQIQYRTVAVTPAFLGKPEKGYWVSGVNATPGSITIVGSKDALKDLNYIQTTPVTIDGATANVVQSVNVVLAEGVSAVGTQRVSVEIFVEPLSGSKTFRIPVGVVGAVQGRDVQVGQIEVLLEGPVPKLDVLKPSDLTASVNISGLNPGMYKLTPQVQAPTGFKVVRLDPSEADVIIK